MDRITVWGMSKTAARNLNPGNRSEGRGRIDGNDTVR
jgi:hypothetical protein